MGGSGTVEMHCKQFSSMVWEPSKDGVQLAGVKTHGSESRGQEKRPRTNY